MGDKSNAFNKYQKQGLDREHTGQAIVVGDETFNLPSTIQLKPNMTHAEEQMFIAALQNLKHGLISLECLGVIAQNPSWYTSMGILLPAHAVQPIKTYPEINITNDDPENWKVEAEGPYIPKGFRHQEVAAKVFREGIVPQDAYLDNIKRRLELGFPSAAPSTDEVIASAVEMDKKKEGTLSEIVSQTLLETGWPDATKMPAEEFARMRKLYEERERLVRLNQKLLNGPDRFLIAIPNQEPMIVSPQDVTLVWDNVPEELDSAFHIVDKDLQKLWYDKMTGPVSPKEEINHPSHYNQFKDVEIIDVCEELNFNRGNAVKYVARAGFKNEDTEIQDLEKALWYVERELGRDNADFSLGDMARVERLVEQMNFHRGTAVWLIACAGKQGQTSATTDLGEAVCSIKAEIKRLKGLSA